MVVLQLLPRSNVEHNRAVVRLVENLGMDGFEGHRITDLLRRGLGLGEVAHQS